MRPLHVQLLVSDPDREDVAAIRDALRTAGHVVVSEEVPRLPEGVSPAPDFVVTEGAALPAPESLAAAEKRHLQAVLRFTGGNKRQAALVLGIARSTLLAKVRRYQLE
ncbi:MAG: helix-turn-helix domain-containing protein [Gemmatimonadales bacterium]